MSKLLEKMRRNFDDEEYRNSYAESFMNTFVAAQIKTLREEFPLTQEELAKKTGTQQPGIARLENVNYSSWKVESLRKLARALHVRLKISFEEFGTLPGEVEAFNKESIARKPYEKDPAFSALSPVAATSIESSAIDPSNPTQPAVERLSYAAKKAKHSNRKVRLEDAGQLPMVFDPAGGSNVPAANAQNHGLRGWTIAAGTTRDVDAFRGVNDLIPDSSLGAFNVAASQRYANGGMAGGVM